MGELLDGAVRDEGLHTTSRKSARNARVEIITRGERRRSWALDQKRDIAAEPLRSGLTLSEIARKHAIGTGQLYSWRRQFLAVRSGLPVAGAVPRFAEVESAAPLPDNAVSGLMPALRSGELIEIVLPSGVAVRVGPQVDTGLLRRVFNVLKRR